MSPASIRRWRGEAAVVLAAAGYEAVFLPDLGMLGASLTQEGRELLSLHGGVSAYRGGHTTGLPLLAPWANRLSRDRFRAAGRQLDLGRTGVHRDGNGLSIHGTMTAQPGWEIVRLEPTRLVAAFDYGARPDLLAAFPFPHVLEIDASVGERGLRVETALRATGDRPVPVSFGWHPYFRLPGPRARCVLGTPALTRLELDARAIPTGVEFHAPAARAALGDRSLDDHFRLGRSRRFTLAGRGRGIEVRFGAGYDHAQLFAPPGKPFVAIEPMTAPIDGLVRGACRVVEPGGRFEAAFSVAGT